MMKGVQEVMSDMVYRCVGGAQVGTDGVCTEHGETACVIGVRVPSTRDDHAPSADSGRVTAPSASSGRSD